MKFHIFVGLLYVLPLGYASAAALERSGQSVHALFEKRELCGSRFATRGYQYF